MRADEINCVLLAGCLVLLAHISSAAFATPTFSNGVYVNAGTVGTGAIYAQLNQQTIVDTKPIAGTGPITENVGETDSGGTAQAEVDCSAIGSTSIHIESHGDVSSLPYPYDAQVGFDVELKFTLTEAATISIDAQMGNDDQTNNAEVPPALALWFNQAHTNFIYQIFNSDTSWSGNLPAGAYKITAEAGAAAEQSPGTPAGSYHFNALVTVPEPRPFAIVGVALICWAGRRRSPWGIRFGGSHLKAT